MGSVITTIITAPLAFRGATPRDAAEINFSLKLWTHNSLQLWLVDN